MDGELISQSNNDISQPGDFTKFEQYLVSLGLPTDNVIADVKERARIMGALPDFIQSLQPEIRREARYLSKFIAGSAIGLFDAALNYVWNEVIVNLRKKIVFYGLDLFYDAAVGEKVRDLYTTEEDLSGIKDKTLLDTCKKLELIDDLVYNKLSHILTMRNDIGSSHPNNHAIKSFELLGWLQTCIEDVIVIRPSQAALTVKSIVDNIKREKAAIRADVIATFENSIKDLSTKMTGNLLVTVFGLFTSENTDKIIRENILMIAPVLWSHSNDSVKYDLGEKVDVFKLNLNTERMQLAESFLEKCDGNRYLTLSTRNITISSLCDELLDAHNGWDNFYHEVPYARAIMKYIEKSEDIPEEREEKLIETFLICRLGNGKSYNQGVSPGARELYNKLFCLLSENQVKKLLFTLTKSAVRVELSGDIRSGNFRTILSLIRSPLNSDRVNEAIDYLHANYSNAYHAVISKPYKDLMSTII